MSEWTDDERATIADAVKAAADAVNGVIQKAPMDGALRAEALLCIGCSAILSMAKAHQTPHVVLLTAFKRMIEHAIEAGWMPQKPDGARMLLVLDDVASIETQVPSGEAVH